MADKLLAIVGPTGVGKTSLALKMAERFDGEIISADSRQVYKGMDIGTGKDLPVNSKFKLVNSQAGGYYLIGGVKVWGYDLVEPTEEFSVAHYAKFAHNAISTIFRSGHLPILVGGTGLYISAVVDGIDTIAIPRNEALRKHLEKKFVAELFDMLAHLAPMRAAKLNSSDKRNRVRLVRAIEVASSKEKVFYKKHHYEALLLGLYLEKEELVERIGARVRSRIGAGFKKEVKDLLESGVGYEHQSMQALGYKGSGKWLKGRAGDGEFSEAWARAEARYARRQMTWFKRDKRIHWFDVASPDYPKKVEATVGKWYP